MWRQFVLACSLASAALFGCSSDKYLYSPAEKANATVSGLPAGRYEIPPERPLGTVLVASPGVVEMKFDGNVKTRMLSARMVVMNNQDDAVWKVDTRELRAVIAGVGESAPAYVNTDAPGLPVISIARGEKRTFDLFYPLPPEADKAKNVPEFDLVWQVHTGPRPVAERTPFERLDYYGWGFSPFWWHDPFVPGPLYAVGSPVYWNYMRPANIAPVPLYWRAAPPRK
jgi:hypothetical protein